MINNKLKKGIFTIGLVIGVIYQLAAQQTSMLNHYFLNPYLYNPAMAGQSDETKAFFHYRQQWTGISGAPETQAFTIDGPLKSNSIGLGLHVVNDVSNITSRFSGMVTSSYTVHLAQKHHLSFGLSAGVIQNTIDFDKINVEDDSDEALLQSIDSRAVFEGGAGFSYRYDKLRIGFATEQLFNRTVTYKNSLGLDALSFTLVRHYLTTVQYDFQLGESFKLTPLVLMRSAQGLSAQVEANLAVSYRDILWVNAAYRHEIGTAFAAGAKVGQRFIIGYSYEMPSTDLAQIAGGSHEFVLGVKLFKGKEAVAGTGSRPSGKMVEELQVKNKEQYEKLDELQQNNESLNAELERQKAAIEAQNNEIEKLRSIVSAYNEDVKKSLEEMKVDLKEEISFDEKRGYYLIVGALRSLDNARVFQTVLQREANLNTQLMQNDNKTWYFIYTEQLTSPEDAIDKVKTLEQSEASNFIIGNPWVYKSNENKID